MLPWELELLVVPGIKEGGVGVTPVPVCLSRKLWREEGALITVRGNIKD